MNQLKVPLAEIPAIARESLAVVYDAIHAGHLNTFLVGRRRFARPEAICANAGSPVTYRARSAERAAA
jgi:hypothetical protein